MGWTPPEGLDVAERGVEQHLKEASIAEVTTIGLDLAKLVFQAHRADAAGAVVFRKTLRRHKVLAFFAAQPPCLIAMESCGGSHYWARAICWCGSGHRRSTPCADIWLNMG